MKISLELKIKDKTIKLTEEEARELGETLATMFDLKKTEYIHSYPWYPWRYKSYWDDWTITYYQTDCDNTGTMLYNKAISNDVTAIYTMSAS